MSQYGTAKGIAIPADKTPTDACAALTGLHPRPIPQEDFTMSTHPITYTIDQIALAARELREAAGADPERYTAAEVASLLSGEIEILRQRGFTDQRITNLLSAFDIEIQPRQPHPPPPLGPPQSRPHPAQSTPARITAAPPATEIGELRTHNQQRTTS
jgi:hypothetical protein